MEPDREIELWARRLAGCEESEDPSEQRRIDALRAAILAEAKADHSVDLNDGLQRLTARLELEGLIEPLLPPTTGMMVGRIGESVRSSKTANSSRYLALASLAGVAVLVGVLLPRNLPERVDPSPPVERARGFAGAVKLQTADPMQRAKQLAEGLTRLGLKPNLLTDGNRHIVEVDVTEAEVAGFYEWSQVYVGPSLRVSQAGTYRLIVEP
ncbi:MAG: hypothetical protein V4650_00060 [Pseudomonadota bacterium]